MLHNTTTSQQWLAHSGNSVEFSLAQCNNSVIGVYEKIMLLSEQALVRRESEKNGGMSTASFKYKTIYTYSVKQSYIALTCFVVVW